MCAIDAQDADTSTELPMGKVTLQAKLFCDFLAE
jgi:hypothetical protein